MRINNNIPALQVFDSVRSANRLVSGSMLRLSSGYRINSARDDAAGLAISNRMRRQIDGLEMASRNAMDGISMVQTAEGALTEVHNMIQRMRELAVMAANGHMTDADRQLVQDEVDQLLHEINEISMRTEFNGNKLFGPKANQANGFTFLTAPSGTADAALSRVMSGISVSDGFPQGDFTNLTLTSLVPNILVAGAGAPPIAGAPSFNLAGGGNVDILSVSVVNDTQIRIELGGAHVGEYAIMNVDRREVSPGNFEVIVPDPSGGWQSVDATTVTPLNLNISYRDHSDMVLQIGPSSGMEMIIRIPQLNADTLGLTGLDLTLQEFFLPGSAANPIDVLESALRDVSTVRSRLGAYQNRLESTVASVDVTSENTTIALSRIRDTDMAREMTRYTTNSVLSQAGISIMAQANQRPQQILALVGQ